MKFSVGRSGIDRVSVDHCIIFTNTGNFSFFYVTETKINQQLSKFVFYEQFFHSDWELTDSCMSQFSYLVLHQLGNFQLFSKSVACQQNAACHISLDICMSRMLLPSSLCRKSIDDERQVLTKQPENTITNVSKLKRRKVFKLCFDLQKMQGKCDLSYYFVKFQKLDLVVQLYNYMFKLLTL